jgi:mediator of RNA polymerase II transcription subunit 13
MFPLTDCLDGINSPGNGCLDFTDPMLLPILDIPTLEGLERPSAPKDVEVFEVPSTNPELHECVKTPDVIPESQSPIVDSLPKLEAMLLLAPGYEPVLLPNGHTHQQSIFKSTYVPESKRPQSDGRALDFYVYGATPPLSPKLPSIQRKREHYDVLERAAFSMKKMKSNDTILGHLSEKSLPVSQLSGLVGKSTDDNPVVLGRNSSSIRWSNSSAYRTEESSTKTCKRQFSTTMLATLMDCFLVQYSFLQVRNLVMKSTKEAQLSTSDSIKSGIKGVLINQQEKKKDHIPSRIAGDIDEDNRDSSRLSNVGVGVWRPVGTPKPQIMPSWNETMDNTAITNEDSGNTRLPMKPNHWQELLDILPLLIQQASVSFDAAFDGDCGAGPYGWLTCKEQERRKNVCGPDNIHAGCGGQLCTSHFLDNAGVELIDPLADEVATCAYNDFLLMSRVSQGIFLLFSFF